MRAAVIPILLLLLRFCRGHRRGAPCEAQHSLRPSPVFHGPPVISSPPPFRFRLLHPVTGRPVRRYRPKRFYKVRLSGKTPFRGFLIQARLGNKDGSVVGVLRAGRFLHDPSWPSQGIQFQACPPALNNSITHVSASEKRSVTAYWQIERDLGPLQFVLTVVSEQSVFWADWRPKHGLILPGTNRRQPRRLPFQEVPITTTEPAPRTLPQFPLRWRPQLIAKPTLQRGFGNLVPIAHITEAQKERKQGTFAPFLPEFDAELSEEEESSEVTDVPTTTALAKLEVFGPESAAKLGHLQAQTISTTPPPTQRVLIPDSFGSASEHVLSRTTTTTDAPCDCYNDGICVWANGRHLCRCRGEFSGPQCLQINQCHLNECFAGSTCKAREGGGYKCLCAPGYSGSYCQLQCPGYLCRNGGTCAASDDGHYYCNCPKLYYGAHCEHDTRDWEVRETSSPLEWQEIPRTTSKWPAPATTRTTTWSQTTRTTTTPLLPALKEPIHSLALNCECENDGRCVEGECVCPPGWLGSRCQRPCMDFFHSCAENVTEEDCAGKGEFMRVHCPLTCGLCQSPPNFQKSTETPLAPGLEPLGWLLGEWEGQVAEDGGNVTITILPGSIPLFGQPSLRFHLGIPFQEDIYADEDMRQEWTSPEGELFQASGFIRVGPFNDTADSSHYFVSLQTASNHGFSHVEEGVLRERRLELTLRQQLPPNNPPWKKERTLELLSPGKLEEILTVRKFDEAEDNVFATLYTRLTTVPPY